jgi:RHS repeat-associated protein
MAHRHPARVLHRPAFRTVRFLVLSTVLVGSGHSCGPADDGPGQGETTAHLDKHVAASTRALIDPATVLVNTGTDVGTLEGRFSVGHDGSANYVVPLWTPDSISPATQPSLALTYSSRAGEGRLGHGWDVSGLSEITRCPKGLHLSESKGPIEFTSADLLCLDGVRLNYVAAESTGSAGEAGAVYRTEPDQFARIKVISFDDKGPLAIEVRTRDGLIHQYGAWEGSEGTVAEANRAAPRAAGDNTTGAVVVSYAPVRYAWSLWKTEDRYGNRMQTYYWPRLPGLCATSQTPCYHLGSGCLDGGGMCLNAGLCAVGGQKCTDLGQLCSSNPDDACEAISHEPQALPKAIYYGARGTDQLRRYVVFYYAERHPEARRTKNVGGVKFQNKWRNFWVEMWAPDPANGNNATLFRGYKIDTYPLGAAAREMVKSITECDGDAKYSIPATTTCKKPTEFLYEPGDDSFQLAGAGANPVNDMATLTNPNFWRMMVADLNNDGRDDILYRTGRDWKYSLSKCQNDLTTCGYDKGIILNIAPNLAGDPSTAKPYDPLIGDWDLDGIPDLAGINPNTPTSYTFYKGNGTSFSTSFSDGEGRQYQSLFLLSNGKGEPTLFRTRHNYWSPYLPSERAWANVGMTWYEPNPESAWNFYAADVNGDGTTELLHRQDATIKRLMVGRGYGPAVQTTLPISEPGKTRKYLFADLNGDQISDAIQLVQGELGPRTIENTGNGFKHAVLRTLPADANIRMSAGTAWNDLTDPGIRILDHDGDGRDDILLVDDGRIRGANAGTNPATRSAMRVLLSRNSGFEKKDVSIYIGKAANGELGRDIPAGALYSNRLLTQVLDANGDNQMDIVIANGTTGQLELYLRTGKPRDKMTRVKDGMGHRTDIVYAPISNRNVYTPGVCTPPQQCLKEGPWVVENFRTDNGIALSQTTTFFKYFDARLDTQAGINLGFARRQTTYPTHTVDDKADLDLKSDVSLVSGTVRVYPGLGAGMSREVTTSVPAGPRLSTSGPTLRSVYRTNGNTSYYADTLNDLFTEKENGVSLRIVSQDRIIPPENVNYGLVSQTHTYIQENWSVFQNYYKQETLYYNNPNLNLWLIGVPTKVTTTDIRAGQPTAVRTIDFDIEELTGYRYAMYTEKASTDPDVFKKNSFWRNPHGKLFVIMESDLLAKQKQVLRIDYDSLEGIYPTYIEDAVGHVTWPVTHRGLGVVGEIVEPNGGSTKFTYDGFGRPRSVKEPGSGGATWTYARALESGSLAADERFILSVTKNIDGGGQSKTDFNRLGQAIRRERTLMDPLRFYGTNPYFTAYSNLTYNAVGALQTVTRPKALGTPAGVPTTYVFDNLYRPTSVSRPSGTEAGGGAWSASYSGRVTTIADEVNHQTRVTHTPSGLVARQESKNDAGSWVPTNYEYGPFDVLTFVRRTPASGGTPIQTEMRYDVLGRMIVLLDPDAHTRQTRYNAFGEIRGTTDAKMGETTYVRDDLGREKSRVTPDGTITTDWDSGTGGVGQIAYTTRDDAIRAYDYDAFGRLIRNSLFLFNGPEPAQILRTEIDYDPASGQVSKLRYPPYSGTSRIEVRMDYDPNSGELAKVTDTRTGGAVYWQRQRNHPDGQIELEQFGNNIQTTRSYFAETGRLSSIVGKLSATIRQSLGYKYWNDGSLKVRSNLVTPVDHERFEYDAMDRIKKWAQATSLGAEIPSGWKVNYTIDDLGNLTQRQSINTASNVQNFINTYAKTGNAGPHAVTSSTLYGAYTYDGNGNQTGRPGNEIVTYNAEDLPKTISGVASRAANFRYDADGSRVEKVKTASGEVTVYLDGLYERRKLNSTTTEHLHYIFGPEGVVAQVTRPVVNGAVGTEATRYLHPDHLGSLERSTCGLGVTGCTSGSISEARRYDPFGNRISSTTSKHLPTTLGDVPSSSGIRRGFTGHEDDSEQSLINMKGRMFDPRTGRFLTPDPIVQTPFDGQSYNRYAYVRNNPLRYRDPSGLAADQGEGIPIWKPTQEELDWIYNTQLTAAESFGAPITCRFIGRFACPHPPPKGGGSGGGVPTVPGTGPSPGPGRTTNPPPPPPKPVYVPGPGGGGPAPSAGVGATGTDVRGSGNQGGNLQPWSVSDLPGRRYPWNFVGPLGPFDRRVPSAQDAIFPSPIGDAVAIAIATGGASLAIRGMAAVGEVLATRAVATRVFWSGGGVKYAGAAARRWAEANGAMTLEMTLGGRSLTLLTSMTDYSLTRPLWEAASSRFARGAVGDVHLFVDPRLASPIGNFLRLELPALLQNDSVRNVGFHLLP